MRFLKWRKAEFRSTLIEIQSWQNHFFGGGSTTIRRSLCEPTVNVPTRKGVLMERNCYRWSLANRPPPNAILKGAHLQSHPKNVLHCDCRRQKVLLFDVSSEEIGFVQKFWHFSVFSTHILMIFIKFLVSEGIGPSPHYRFCHQAFEDPCQSLRQDLTLRTTKILLSIHIKQLISL